MNFHIARFAIFLAVIATSRPCECMADSFSIPGTSQRVIGVMHLDGEDVGAAWTQRFAECDSRNSVSRIPVKFKCTEDPNHNSVVLALPNRVVFFDAKMSLDRDGSTHSRLKKGTDQAETSLRYPQPKSESLDADRVPFVVMPGNFLDQSHRAVPGDLAAVVHQDRLAFAIVGDMGLPYKIGEGSVRLHELLGHEVCITRTAAGDCDRAKENESIKEEVLYFIFLDTARELLPGLTSQNIGERIETLGSTHWQQLLTAIQSR